MIKPLLIDRANALKKFVSHAINAPWLGLDTEFVRDRTYFPRAGLIQIATPDEIALVDPVGLPSLAALEPLLFDSAMPKIMHAASQDMELFFCLFKKLPTPVFDTQVAAATLDFAPQIGHADLVEELLQGATPPALGRYDWLHRPLDAQAIDYASADVIHLGAMYQRLGKLLEEHDKTENFNKAMLKITAPERYRPQPELAWKRIRAARRMNDEALSRLKSLAQWREEQAIKKNLPRQWVLRDKTLVVLAQIGPHSAEQLADIPLLNAKARQRYGSRLLTLLADT